MTLKYKHPGLKAWRCVPLAVAILDDAQLEDVIRNREVQRADVAPQYHSQPVLDHKSHVLEIESLIRHSIKKN